MNNLIGNTPMVKIKYEYKGKVNSIYTKLEFYNYTGSIKDRVIDYILQKNIENGNLKKGMTIEVKNEDSTTQILIGNMISLLKELEENYPENIKVK